MADEEFREIEQSMWAHVRPLVIEALPKSGLMLLDGIESFAGIQIGFRDMDLLRQAGGMNTDHEALFCAEDRAYVSVPDLANINANAVVHELLHLQRYWVEGIPLLEAKHDIGSNVELFANIDNALEHLIIVPQERCHGFDPGPHWATNAAEIFADHPWPGRESTWQRGACLLGWMTASLSEDLAVTRDITAKVSGSGLLVEAQRMSRRLKELEYSKPRMAAAALRFLNIPAEAGVLVKYDVRNRKALRLPVPSR